MLISPSSGRMTSAPVTTAVIALSAAVISVPIFRKEFDKLTKEVERVQKKLGNEGFIKKAPEHVIEEERGKEKDYTAS
jgi:valyl-tRNA synthetase